MQPLGTISVDTETTGVGWHDEAFMVSLATSKTSRVWDRRWLSDAQWQEALVYILDYLTSSDKIIMHNAKFDIQKLCRLGIPLSTFKDKFEDTQAVAHLINEQQSTSLKYLARTVLGKETDEDEVLKVWRRKNKIKKDQGYEPIPYEILAPYAVKDAEFTLALWSTLSSRMPPTLQPLYELEKRLTLVLLGIEARGMSVDREYVTKKRKDYNDKIYQTKTKIAGLSGAEFNPQSPAQVIEALAQRGVRVTGTDKATLAGLDDPLAALIVELRESNKIKSTYFDALFDEAKDGVLHPNFRQHGTVTGRMSSGAAEA